MITNNEINAVNLSTTKKDFYQIWEELLEVAKKLSDRWDPTTTNESDPGIVLLKVATALADKINYNTDKNILEAFMPSASQEESMRKLCEMLGYTVKYYQSATTQVKIKYNKKNADGKVADIEGNDITINIPQFTTITNVDADVNYLTLKDITLGDTNNSETVDCIEGQLAACETNNDNIISINMLDDTFRYYLPETQIAENGIFIYNIDNNLISNQWTKVSNLNAQQLNYKCYKFGYDSKEKLPYVQFPEDIGSLIEDGLLIYYVRTSGVNGNVAANTLTTMTQFWTDEDDLNIDVADFTCVNVNASKNGTDIETINKAYNNFKKTIGTFDTLITCRDYMNTIYQLVSSVDNTTPLVSNCLVTDIRDDINNAYTLCSFNDYGICYKNKAINANSKDLITNFDLVLYPFKTYNLNTKTGYMESFKYTAENTNEIISDLEDQNTFKTASHNFKLPNSGDICAIKVYLKLNARITTINKVNDFEANDILSNIYTAIYTNFNMREIDFGEEIPFDTILEVIENADTRIKNVALDEPELYTRYHSANNATEEDEDYKYYTQVAVKNILAGHVSLFDYDNDFETSYLETGTGTKYPENGKTIKALKTNFEYQVNQVSPISLKENEVIDFRAPNFKTLLTYPAYVNYYYHKDDSNNTNTNKGIPATMRTLDDFMTTNKQTKWTAFITWAQTNRPNAITQVTYKASKSYYGYFTKGTEGGIETYTWAGTPIENESYYTIEFDKSTFGAWNSWIQTQVNPGDDADPDNPSSQSTATIDHLYINLGYDASRVVGHLIDNELNKYQARNTFATTTDNPLEGYYVPYKWIAKAENHTMDGLGEDAKLTGIPANSEYELSGSEYILINYTDPDDIVQQVYLGDGTIIKPNFDIIDSATKHENTGASWAKTTGINQDWYKLDPTDPPKKTSVVKTATIAGMYSLGANEQIELRGQVKVKLPKNDNTNINVYWITNDNSTNFFSEKNSADNWIRELQNGEYLLYTDSDKDSFAYYGSGCEIISPVQFTKKATDVSDLTIDDALNSAGLEIIPWISVHISKKEAVEIKEYQFISLTEDDSASIKAAADSINSDGWTPVEDGSDGTKYTLSGTEHTLPTLVGTTWEARARLELNVGPTQAQTLTAADSIEIIYNEGNSDTITGNSSGTEITTIKTNYALKSNSIITNCGKNIYDEDLLYERTEYNLAIKKVNVKDITIEPADSSESNETLAKINLHNYGKYWTSIEAESLYKDSTASKATLNISIPSNDFGLIMMYLICEGERNDTDHKNIYLTTNNGALGIYNYGNDAWWDGREIGGKYYLNPGINIIKVTSSTSSITIHPEISISEVENGTEISVSKVVNGNLIFGDLSLAKNSSINKALGNNITLDALRDKIRTYDIDNNFYYNCPIENAVAININQNAGETLASPRIFYDKNNICNKFVISEIDASYLKTGLQIAKSSKK